MDTDKDGKAFEIVNFWRSQLMENNRELAAEREAAGIFPFDMSDGEQGNPALARLEAAWEQIDRSGYGPYANREFVGNMGSAPLAALFCYAQMGLQPPPELLLACAEQFDEYMESGGSLSLEAAFFGPPVRHAGNYARRAKSKVKWSLAATEIAATVDRLGITDTDAAEQLADKYGVGLSGATDTLLRYARRHWNRTPRAD